MRYLIADTTIPEHGIRTRVWYDVDNKEHIIKTYDLNGVEIETTTVDNIYE